MSNSDEPTGRLALVFELMDMNMYDAIKGKRHYLPENRVKYYIHHNTPVFTELHIRLENASKLGHKIWKVVVEKN